ncbi:MAG: AAA family ATPase [Bacteroides sp.]|nr:AAA family ATPase [Bacteroides sp.]
MEETVRELFVELKMLCDKKECSLLHKYRSLRASFERVVREQMRNVSLQSTDLAARINYLAAQFSLDDSCRNALHTFRLTSNDVMNGRKEPIQDVFLRDVRSVANAYTVIFSTVVPKELDEILPRSVRKTPMKRQENVLERRIRVCFEYADEEFLYVHPVDEVVEGLWKVRYNVVGVNEEFTDGVSNFWRHAQLNLLDVKRNNDNTYTPSFIVLEPDYLLDISSLAECYRDYGSHPANYLMNRLMPKDNTLPLLLGNIANLFLDEWIHATEEVPDYIACMKKAFRQYSIELATCEDLLNSEKEEAFFKDCQMHFENICHTVTEVFLDPGYRLDKSDAVLEPSYICEALGIQGRLDYMQCDMSGFIEMKSGKADEYIIKGKIEPKENNRAQMLLYMAVLEYSMGIDRRKQHPYLLYTRYPLLYPARASWAHVRRIIALRNRIVALEYGTQMHNHPSYTAELLSQINAVTLNERKLQGRFWEQYLLPDIIGFQKRIQLLDVLERTYVYTLYNFITKELYTSKSGDVDSESKTGASTLWLNSLDEKREAGEILYDLRIIENNASQQHKATITLRMPKYEDCFIPNFRVGDVVVLYERNCPNDNVTNKLVIKGNIEWLATTEVCIRLRASQRNLSIFPIESLYALEHDYMDTTFRSMYLGVSAFMDANRERKDLLLGRRKPLFNKETLEKSALFIDDFERVASKAVSAKDYFLLVGPPGTGKTSRALRRMVEKFYSQPESQILLLAYTNRAIDEICSSLSAIAPRIDYIRIGSELSCDERYRNHLVENVLLSCRNRKEVRQCLSSCRVYVGTVASVSAKMELFKLKRFDVAIIDEATQILEPHLLWILTAKFLDGQDAVGKFVLIGDHKQLPAVVLQRKEDSEVHDESLRKIGMYNLKDSLFERLYRFHLSEEDSPVIDMLCRQGRMHPGVASFSNQAFYNGKLAPIGLPHQLEKIDAPVIFIPSQKDVNSLSGKTNCYEAQIVADYAALIWKESEGTFDANRTLGIITPYRSQIALIRKELQAKGIPDLLDVSVDTVERYQGSERDVIIYSFCVNYLYQLRFLPNLTEENGVQIDRKLNVALTRARKRMIIIGVPEILKENAIYCRLLSFITEKK